MPADTGGHLRSLYEQSGGVANIFSFKVADYVASRPDYPAALFDALATVCKLPADAAVADIGSGTGLLTQGLLQRGYRVVAIEPNASMRRAADHLLKAHTAYRSIDGCAEVIPLDTASVDLITAAQAFHWFEIDRARAECLRVLSPHGNVALIWNDRVVGDPLHVALDEVFLVLGGAKRQALAAHKDRADVPKFFGATDAKELSWPHEHALSEAGLASLVFSRSYMPDRDSASGREALSRVSRVFRNLSSGGLVLVRYTTVAVIGRPE